MALLLRTRALLGAVALVLALFLLTCAVLPSTEAAGEKKQKKKTAEDFEMWWVFGQLTYETCADMMIQKFRSKMPRKELVGKIKKYCVMMEEVIEDELDGSAANIAQQILGSYESAVALALKQPFRNGGVQMVKKTTQQVIDQLEQTNRVTYDDIKQSLIKSFHQWWLDVCTRTADKYLMIRDDGSTAGMNMDELMVYMKEKRSDFHKFKNDERDYVFEEEWPEEDPNAKLQGPDPFPYLNEPDPSEEEDEDIAVDVPPPHDEL